MKKEDREKISHLFKQEMLSGLRHHYIKKDSSGISVFGNYHITKTKDGCYRVKQHSWMENRDFISVKNAMSYCVLHNSQRTDSAVKLYQLDCRLSSINLDIKIHTKGYKTKKNSLDLRLIQLTKLEEDYMKKRQILLEIQKQMSTPFANPVFSKSATTTGNACADIWKIWNVNFWQFWSLENVV